jgi:hypothetical protein
LLGHHRSGARAEYSRTRKRWRSLCKRCGTPMIKIDGRWMTVAQADSVDPPPAAPHNQ